MLLMRNPIRRVHRDQRGMSFVFVGMGFMAFLVCTALAIDIGMFATARSQAQNSADAGALAGAVALAFDDFNDRTATGPAVQNALQGARANTVMGQTVSVTPPDVTFPNDPEGQPTWVRVQVFRNADRGNPVGTLVGTLFGVNTVNIEANATAQAAPANAETCVKPFTIPDKWIEKQTPPWDPNDTFTGNPSNPSLQPDIYIPADKPGYTGYNAVRDKGTALTIRAGTGNNIQPSFYFSWAMPGGTGAAFYRENIAGCNTTVVRWGDLIVPEPGNMVGPTNQGIDDLIAKDPSAYWDSSKNAVQSSMSPSPRVIAIPLYDPVYYDEGKKNGRNADLKVANWMGFFVEYRSGNNVTGRITPIAGIMNGPGPAPAGAFPRVIRLVQ